MRSAFAILRVAAGALLVAPSLFGQIPPEERVSITDPDRLESLGFPRNSAGVWSKASVGASRPKDMEAVREPETWGTATGYSTIMSYQLTSTINSCLTHVGFDFGTWVSGGCLGQANHSYAQILAPDGASLGSLAYWAHDNEPNADLQFNVFETCQSLGATPPISTLIGSAASAGALGDISEDFVLGDVTVNNRDCGYSVLIAFTEPSSELRVRKLRVSWTREVSPAPAQASFNDVPTGHQFFQHVEALVKAGVTAGCGGGNFCPTAPLTRGQMAVFLSRALGLQWP